MKKKHVQNFKFEDIISLAEAKRALGGGWRRRRGGSWCSSSKSWPASLDTCLHSDTHAHDPEGIDYHFPGIGQYLNTSSGWNPVTHKMINHFSRTFSGPSTNCQRIEITVGLPSDGWKFGPAMKGNPSVDNELAIGFPRALKCYSDVKLQIVSDTKNYQQFR